MRASQKVDKLPTREGPFEVRGDVDNLHVACVNFGRPNDGDHTVTTLPAGADPRPERALDLHAGERSRSAEVVHKRASGLVLRRPGHAPPPPTRRRDLIMGGYSDLNKSPADVRAAARAGHSAMKLDSANVANAATVTARTGTEASGTA